MISVRFILIVRPAACCVDDEPAGMYSIVVLKCLKNTWYFNCLLFYGVDDVIADDACDDDEAVDLAVRSSL